MNLTSSNKHIHKRSLVLSTTVALVLALGLSASSHTGINSAIAATGETSYAPTEKQRRVSKLVSAVIERSHYRQSAINDPVSSVMLDRYLAGLDPMRSYFTT